MGKSFDNWITARTPLRVTAPASGSTGSFDNWITARTPIRVYMKGTSGVTIAIIQDGYRFYNDNGSESGATPAQAEDTPHSLAIGSIIQLRIQLDASGANDPIAAQIEYRRQGSSYWKKMR